MTISDIRKDIPLPSIDFHPRRGRGKYSKLHEMEVGDMIFVTPDLDDPKWERKPHTAVVNNNRRESKKPNKKDRKAWTARRFQDPETKEIGVGIWRQK